MMTSEVEIFVHLVKSFIIIPSFAFWILTKNRLSRLILKTHVDLKFLIDQFSIYVHDMLISSDCVEGKCIICIGA